MAWWPGCWNVAATRARPSSAVPVSHGGPCLPMPRALNYWRQPPAEMPSCSMSWPGIWCNYALNLTKTRPELLSRQTWVDQLMDKDQLRRGAIRTNSSWLQFDVIPVAAFLHGKGKAGSVGVSIAGGNR